MLKDRDIVVFADDWGYYPSTMQHVGRVLSRANRLLWIGSLGLRRPALSLADARRAWGKARKMLSGHTGAAAGDGAPENPGAGVPPTVFPCHPLVLPFHDSPAVRMFNMRALRRTVLTECTRRGFHHPILLTSNPLVAPLVGRLGESSAHYICLDDFTLFDRAFHCIAPLERMLLGKVDSVFSVSEILRSSRMPASGEGHFLPQGVDINHFAPSPEALPATMNALKKPVIGFFGLLTSWVDKGLLRRIAASYPDCTVAVIGRSTVETSDLQNIPNLIYLGEIPYGELPRYARAFDVGLIPFLVNELTVAANPLKLLEYLALGIPVVSTNLPEVCRFSSYAYVARSDEEFVALVGTALADRTAGRALERRALASRYDWSVLVEKMSLVIERLEGAGGVHKTKESCR